MNPVTWLAELRQICADSNWDALSELRKHTNQSFTSALDSIGLVHFYEELAATGLDEGKWPEVRIDNLLEFQSGVAELFQTAQVKLASMPQVKGVYFEYFYDGGDSCTGDLFMCSEYSDEDDSWGAEFGQDSFVEGPDVSAYFDFDPDFEWDDFSRILAKEYVNGRLLAVVIQEWQKSGIAGRPLGFANHDHEMVRAPAN